MLDRGWLSVRTAFVSLKITNVFMLLSVLILCNLFGDSGNGDDIVLSTGPRAAGSEPRARRP